MRSASPNVWHPSSESDIQPEQIQSEPTFLLFGRRCSHETKPIEEMQNKIHIANLLYREPQPPLITPPVSRRLFLLPLRRQSPPGQECLQRPATSPIPALNGSANITPRIGQLCALSPAVSIASIASTDVSNIGAVYKATKAVQINESS